MVGKLCEPLLYLAGGHALVQHGLHRMSGVSQDLGVFSQKGVYLKIQVIGGHGAQFVGGAVCGSAGGVHAQKSGNAHQQQQNGALNQKALDIFFGLLHAVRSLTDFVFHIIPCVCLSGKREQKTKTGGTPQRASCKNPQE